MSHVTMSLSPMSHVEFKKCQCRPVDFRGQGPYRIDGSCTMGAAIVPQLSQLGGQARPLHY